MRKFILSPIVLAGLVWFAWHLIQLRPEPKPKEITREAPYVEVVVAESKSMPSTIESHGVVRPHTRTTLIAEVPGIVEGVAPFQDAEQAPSFRAGGFFKKNDLLVKIEEVDLLSSVAEAKANVSRAELQLVQERELAGQAKSEWGDRDWSKAPELVRRLPQIRKAEAEINSAQARLKQAQKNLDRTRVLAPFDGRIIRTMVDRGQRVGGGSSAALAEVYALDAAEIDLSLSQKEISFLGFVDGHSNGSPIRVETLDIEGNAVHRGSLDRSQGMVDPKTRLTNFVARIDNCFANPFSNPQVLSPLSLGQFVKLRLTGKKIHTFILADSAFRDLETILVVDQKNRLHPRKVEVLHRTNRQVWVGKGLKNGDRVCITPIEIISEGMKVRVVGDAPPVPKAEKVKEPADQNGTK